MQTQPRAKADISSSLNENFCVVLPKNASSVYLFWKFSDFKIEKFEKKEYGETLIVKVFDEKESQVMEMPAPWDSGKLYISLPKDDFKCSVRLYSQNGGGLEEIARSNLIEVPAEKIYSSAYSSESMGRRV